MVIAALLFYSSCLKDKYNAPIVNPSGYPDEVDAIITKKCATSGCHNTVSHALAANLDLSTHAKMFNGNGIGAVVIPYRPDLSALLYFINTDTNAGIVQQPTMPVNDAPLSSSEYLIIKNWIAKGAPDKTGVVPFSGDLLRKKFYVINQSCDLLSVFDANSQLLMRYYTIGTNSALQETPQDICFTPDGKYYLIDFANQDFVQMYDAATDSMVATITTGSGTSGLWGKMVVSSDSRHAYVPELVTGRIAIIDLLSKTSSITSPTLFNLFSIAINATNDTLYAGQNPGNYLAKIPVNNPSAFTIHNLRLEPSNLDMSDIVFTPDHSRYFISCAHANRVMVYDAVTDSLVDTFHVALNPQQLAFSTVAPYLFVTCQDAINFAGVTGAVEVLNYNTLTHVKLIEVGYNPYGVVVDDDKGMVYVTNLTLGSSGHGSHHVSGCGGGQHNGSLSIIKLNSLQTLPLSPELSVNPYAIAIRP